MNNSVWSLVLFLDENIADIIGLNAAYNAFSRGLDPREELHLSLPQLNLSAEQLFFLSFAQVSFLGSLPVHGRVLPIFGYLCLYMTSFFFQASCSSGTKEVNEEQLKTGHSPKRYRVIGTLSNIREFSLAFHCPTGSQMNPKEKCEIF